MMKDVSAEERLEHRKVSHQPLVDAYFAWIDDPRLTLGMVKNSNLYKAIQHLAHFKQEGRSKSRRHVLQYSRNSQRQRIETV